MADLDLASAQRKKRELNAQYQSTQNEIAAIQKKIDRLNAAEKKIAAIKKEAKQLKTDASKYNSTKKLGLSWKGENYETYVDFLDGSLKNTFQKYVNGIDDCQDRIITKVTEYENMILRKRTILSGLWTSINDLSAWIRKQLN